MTTNKLPEWVPDKRFPDDPSGGAYNKGWNDCRKAMLAAAGVHQR